MTEIQKAVLGSVRLDSDVWDAVRAMGCSLNVYLRESLLGVGITPEIEKRIAVQVRPQKQTRKAAHIEALKSGDVVAQAVERDDIEYGEHTELPQGENVGSMRHVDWRRGPRQKGDKSR